MRSDVNRRGIVAALTLVGACVMSGCSSYSTPSPGPNVPGPTTKATPTKPVAPSEPPDALVGMWRVTSAAGEPADTVLRLSGPDPFDLILFRDCGEFTGEWSGGTGGAFIAEVDGFASACLNTFTGDD